jgi:4-amino-4-deoxy-L-arabinose transferase-like glycosyltransferase
MVSIRRSWLPPAIVLAAAAALILSGLGAYPLTDRDEGEYAGAVASMERHGDWIIPTLNGRNYLEKPILLFWFVAGSWKLLGRGEFSTRLPSALAALALLASMAWLLPLATRDRRLTLLAILCLAAMPMFQAVAHLCLTDMFVAWSVAWSLLCFFIAMERLPDAAASPDLVTTLNPTPATASNPARGWFLAAWAGLGLGFLAKGPVTPAIVLPTAILYALMQRRLSTALARCRLAEGILVFCVIAGPWYLLAYRRLGQEVIQCFFRAQIVGRGTSVLLGHGGGPLYYLPVLLWGACPFAAVALPGLWTAFVGNRLEQRRQSVCRRLTLLAGLAVAITLALFTAAATKLPHYILPAFPFLAILAADFLLRVALAGRHRTWLLRVAVALLVLVLGVWAALAAALPFVLPRVWPHLEGMIQPDTSEYALPLSPPSIGWLAAIMAVLAVATTIVSWRLLRLRRGFLTGVAMAVGTGLQFLAVMALAIRLLGAIQEPACRLTSDLKPVLRSGDEALTYGLWKPTLFYYLDRDLDRLQAGDDGDYAKLRRRLGDAMPVFVFTRRALLGKLARLDGFQVLATAGGYALGGNPPALAAWRRLNPAERTGKARGPPEERGPKRASSPGAPARRPIAPAAFAESVPRRTETARAAQAEMVRSRMGRQATGSSERPPSPHQPAPV